MLVTVVSNLLINLITYYQQIVLYGQIGNDFEFVKTENPAGWIGRVNDTDHSCLVSNSRFDRRSIYLKTVLPVQGCRDNLAARQLYLIDMLGIIGLQQNNRNGDDNISLKARSESAPLNCEKAFTAACTM